MNIIQRATYRLAQACDAKSRNFDHRRDAVLRLFQLR